MLVVCQHDGDRSLDVTMLMVTHDPAEAARLGDRILVMTPAGIEEVAAPPGPVPRPHDAAGVLAAQAALTQRLLA